jgi:hypothetical protein
MCAQPPFHADEPNYPPARPAAGGFNHDRDEDLSPRDIFNRLVRGLGQTIGLALLGAVIAAVIYLAVGALALVPTSTRVTFSFVGFDKGEYPDHSKFQPDDVCSPDIVAQALKQLGLDGAADFQGRIRGALTIDGVVPIDIARQRDRLRAAGLVPPLYVPNEYILTLTLPRNFPINNQQRALLLGKIVSIYQDNLWHTYADLPPSFGDAFTSLQDSDFPDLQLIFNQDIESIIEFLNKKIENDAGFRSQTTGFTFVDLLYQVQIFSQARLNGILGLIYFNGLSHDRKAAVAKMDYQVRTLEEETSKAAEEEAVVKGLLAQAQEHTQNYVLGIKSQAAQPRSENPIIDQGLVDSLVANDAYNFLVHRALLAGMKAQDLQADLIKAQERKKHLESFLQGTPTDQSTLISQVEKSLAQLEPAYQQLIDNLRKTNTDFARQQLGGTVRLSAPIITVGIFRPTAIAGLVGCFLGLTAGLGLSLLGIYIGAKKNSA